MKRRGFLATAAALFLPWTKTVTPNFDNGKWHLMTGVFRSATVRTVSVDGITIYDSCRWNRCLSDQEVSDTYNYYLEHGTFHGVEAVVPGITHKCDRD